MALEGALEGDFSLAFVVTLAEARKALDSSTFHLAFVDDVLPDGSGFAFFAGASGAIRRTLRNRIGGTIFVTGRLDIGKKVVAFDNGAYDYITKPFEPRELRARVISVRAYSRWTLQPWFREEGAVGGVLMVMESIGELVRSREGAFESARRTA